MPTRAAQIQTLSLKARQHLSKGLVAAFSHPQRRDAASRGGVCPLAMRPNALWFAWIRHRRCRDAHHYYPVSEAMSFDTVWGHHRLSIGMSTALGGKGRGPTPPELFIASLGSYVAVMVASYCERMGLDAKGLVVDVSFEEATEPTRLVNLTVTVRLPNAECGERREAIRRTAQHCPVTWDHRHPLRYQVRDLTTGLEPVLHEGLLGRAPGAKTTWLARPQATRPCSHSSNTARAGPWPSCRLRP